MQTLSTRAVKNEGFFFYLLILTGFFLLAEVSFFIQCNQAYLSDFSFVSDHLNFPLTIVPGILFFIGIQLIIHFVYCFFVWGITKLILKALNLAPQKELTLGIACWIIGLIIIFIVNQFYFPNSKFAELTGALISTSLIKIFFYLALLTLILTSILAAFGLGKLISNRKYLLIFLLIIPLVHFVPGSQKKPIQNIATQEKPNIIFIGVDSLRPDFLSYFGHAKSTPFFDAFLTRATVFNNAMTPLARTFPSWTSILSGEYPRQMHVRFNLAKQNELHLSATIPAILKRQGYETFYATDETRFSNIDKNYGFDKIITPPIGLNDFLIGTFNDFPLSNLLVNTSIGKWLFPYSYGNRAVYATYDPTQFLNLIAPLLNRPQTKPLFLAVHFCLPHHPYLWAGLAATSYKPIERYEKSIVRVDQQVRDFFDLLQNNHLLDHAIVVLLSDHGEALELPGDRITEKNFFVAEQKNDHMPQFYPPSLDHEAVNQSAGHGTDVLGLSQYHTLLAVKLYGMGQQQASSVSSPVSLLDIKPTVLELIHLKDNNTAGISLTSAIWHKSNQLPHRSLFLESDFSPQAIRTVYPETRNVLLEGVQLFEVNPHTTRLTVKDKMGEMIIHSKQYAIIDGNWMLALYPQSQSTRMPILINLKTGKWTNKLSSSFALRSPASHLLNRLKSFYGNEITNLNP